MDLGPCQKMRMVLIPAGTFTMGTNATDNDWQGRVETSDRSFAALTLAGPTQVSHAGFSA